MGLYAMVLAVIILFCSQFILTRQVNFMHASINRLRDESQLLLAPQVHFSALSSSQMTATQIKQWTKERLVIHHFFDVIGKNKYNQLCFSQIKRKKKSIYFSGKAPSALALTDFLERWPVNDLFSEIKMNEMHKQADGNIAFNFYATIDEKSM